LSEDEIDACVSFVTEHQLAEFISELLWNRLFRDLRTNFSPEFWSHFIKEDDEGVGSEKFSLAVRVLKENIDQHVIYIKFLDCIRKSSCNHNLASTLEQYKIHLSAVLLSQIPKDFESIVYSFYSKAFRAFTNSEKRSFTFGKVLRMIIFMIFKKNSLLAYKQMLMNLEM
jgi:hypothetical protein